MSKKMTFSDIINTFVMHMFMILAIAGIVSLFMNMSAISDVSVYPVPSISTDDSFQPLNNSILEVLAGLPFLTTIIYVGINNNSQEKENED